MRLAIFKCVGRRCSQSYNCLPARGDASIPTTHPHRSRPYVMGIALLCVLMCCECAFGLPRLHAQVTAFDHTAPALDATCNQAYYSPDGNPFQLCPGPYPGGGNCVWWAWEQWHLLGYTLPLNWGNAADWIVDAERTGLPLGEVPRVGSIAVFPVADGVWAFGPAGHVAFVTWVSADGSTFDVTYQNYGDPTPMYTGAGYPVQVINEPRYQHGELLFIYFPLPIDPNRFAQLPGVSGSGLSEVIQANRALATGSALASNQAAGIMLGLPQGSPEQEFDADFVGNGLSDLLLYTRAQGRLDVLNPSYPALPKWHYPPLVYDDIVADPTAPITPQRISLADATTPAGGWGSALDIRIGDFTGSGQSEILLYDRVTGQIQLLVLTPQLRIKQHITLPGWGGKCTWGALMGSAARSSCITGLWTQRRSPIPARVRHLAPRQALRLVPRRVQKQVPRRPRRRILPRVPHRIPQQIQHPARHLARHPVRLRVQRQIQHPVPRLVQCQVRQQTQHPVPHLARRQVLRQTQHPVQRLAQRQVRQRVPHQIPHQIQHPARRRVPLQARRLN